jgi:hypothetical protein
VGPGNGRLLVAHLRLQFRPASDDRSGKAYWQRNLDRWAQTIKAGIETTVNARVMLDSSGARLAFEVDVSTSPKRQAGFDQIALHHGGSLRSLVNEVRPFGGPPTHGEWLVDEPPVAWLHEAGHLIGLEDQYTAFLTDKSGRQVEIPDGLIVRTDVRGKILNKPDLRELARKEGLDYKTLREDDKINAGHERDIMGDARAPGVKFLPTDLDRLFVGASNCPDVRPTHITCKVQLRPHSLPGSDRAAVRLFEHARKQLLQLRDQLGPFEAQGEEIVRQLRSLVVTDATTEALEELLRNELWHTQVAAWPSNCRFLSLGGQVGYIGIHRRYGYLPTTGQTIGSGPAFRSWLRFTKLWLNTARSLRVIVSAQPRDQPPFPASP